MTVIVQLSYLAAAIAFILALKLLSRVRTAITANKIAAVGMLFAIVGAALESNILDWRWVILGIAIGSAIGTWSALKVQMTNMPQLVALFNGLGGAASAFVGAAYVLELTNAQKPLGIIDGIATGLSLLVGVVTLSGSIIAWAKLDGRMRDAPILLPARHVINAALLVGSLVAAVAFGFVEDPTLALAITLAVTLAALVLGIGLVIPIGGADMPVVIALLNAYSGIAAAMTGFVLNSSLLIIAGSLVGASGIILTRIMCVAMNRSLLNVLFGGFGAVATASGKDGYTKVKSATAEDAAGILEGATSVIMVPGYGLAVSQAQHATRELDELLEKRGCSVRYAIHPVAGRMPGHMNVLLAEANIPYEKLVEMESINSEFKTTDVVIVLGANDVVNPAALDDKQSPLYGMPILNVHEARTVMVVKRSLSPGFAGVKNPLFEADNALMIFADAKKALEQMTAELKRA